MDASISQGKLSISTYAESFQYSTCLESITLISDLTFSRPSITHTHTLTYRQIVV